MPTWHQRDGLEWLSYGLLQDIPQMVHGSFTRIGGSSEGEFASLNLSLTVDDNPSAVHSNLVSVQEVLGCGTLRHVQQTHGLKTVYVTPQTDLSHATGDILITNIPRIPLMIKHADCQAAIFYDPVAQVLALTHAGWRGQALDVYGTTIATLQQKYHCSPANLLVCISPSLGPKYAEFRNYQKELPTPFWEFRIGEHHFDLWSVAEWQLTSRGILSHHIEIARDCTYSNPQRYFSYRRSSHEQRPTGRLGTIASL